MEAYRRCAGVSLGEVRCSSCSLYHIQWLSLAASILWDSTCFVLLFGMIYLCCNRLVGKEEQAKFESRRNREIFFNYEDFWASFDEVP
jgi:hypothetical protein